MSKTNDYIAELQKLDDWEPYLRRESGLPGPRANLALAEAVAEVGDKERFEQLIAFGPNREPTNTPDEFLALCGVVGLGKLLAQGDSSVLPQIHSAASDPRWRMREGVALALQKLGKADMDRLLALAAEWAQGNLLEQRAAAAAICEPALLKNPQYAERVLAILETITASMEGQTNRKSDDFSALRKALGYCWSVAVAAYPTPGKAAMDRWLVSADKDIAWIMRENLKKHRLSLMDPAWTISWQEKLGSK